MKTPPPLAALRIGSFVLLLLLLGMSLLSGGCDQPTTGPAATTGPAPLPTVRMKIGAKTFTLEVARSHDEQETGLMHRDAMPADHGMIFMFRDEEPLSFWMKNTRIPLDIVFADAHGKIVSIKQMRAYDLHNTYSDAPAQYAIELNRGAAQAAGAKVGDILDIPAAARP